MMRQEPGQEARPEVGPEPGQEARPEVGPEPGQEAFIGLLHDLRTPLAIVSGFAELLARNDSSLSPAQRTDYVERIAAAASEMRDLLDAERSRRRCL
jgi:nitrogen-specific signal transduction histidine kinase